MAATTNLSRSKPRPGVSSLEMLVSFGLLAAILGTATPLIVRHGRLLAPHREYQWALDELTNQLDRLTSLPVDQLPQAVKDLQPSSFAAEHLPDAELIAELAAADVGQRLTLRLAWNEPGRRAAPLTLSAWVMPSEAQEAKR
jgi:hypothetical protein